MGKSSAVVESGLYAQAVVACTRFLDRKGYQMLDTNWTSKGEGIGVIAQDGDEVVFIEVKVRSSVEKGLPTEVVTASKRKRMEILAALWLAEHNTEQVPLRFDVVSLLVVACDRALIRHHINAL